MLKEAVEAADKTIMIDPRVEALDPLWLEGRPLSVDVLHLNYQAALHSRWTLDRIRRVQQLGIKVVVTYHDTGVPNSDQCKAIVDAADVTIIHEPADDLPAEKVRYWRMGVPGPRRPTRLTVHGASFFASETYDAINREIGFEGWDGQPVLGSIGFPLPWKNYDTLAAITRDVGWALLLIAPTADRAQCERWRAINPDLLVRTDFVSQSEATSLLAGCDATAFHYVCHNTGQSGAILQGIAARKPVLALSTCRQFRALYDDPLGKRAIRWYHSDEGLAMRLRETFPHRYDPGIVALAEQESWATLGAKYAALYRGLVA
jgi:glycosyltransferase involved in cell wall biosynthesis